MTGLKHRSVKVVAAAQRKGPLITAATTKVASKSSR